MGDGPQARQQLDNVQRVSTTRAWRCLLLLGATGMLAVACSLHWRYNCSLCAVTCMGFVPNEAEQQHQQVPVDAMGDESQVPSKATRHSSTA